MEKRHLSFMFAFLSLIFSLIYFVFMYMQNRGNLFLIIAMLWTIALPILSSFPYSYKYLLCLPSPFFGALLLVLTMTAKYTLISPPMLLVASSASLLLVLATHFLTRKRVVFWKITLSTLSRGSIAAVSVMLFGLGLMVVNPSAFVLDPMVEVFYFSVILFGYVAASMLYVNESYRLYALSNRLKVQNLQKEMSELWAKILVKYPNAQSDLDLLQYYFDESLRCFLEGDFEKSFIWGYKVIREKTVADPNEYVDDKRAGKLSLSEIRNTLEHSRRKGHVEASKIRSIVRNLFHDCLDLLEREHELIVQISTVFPSETGTGNID